MKPAPTAMKKESDAARRARARKIARRLERDYSLATCALHHESPLQLLISTILSAQCTDERVNLVTKDLFRKYTSARAFADSPPGELEREIRSTGFFNNKAKNIRGCCRALLEKHGGQVPRTMDELLELPGVARKTANVVLGTAFGTAVGVVVDTHVTRIANLLGLTKQQQPQKIERDLMELLPQEEWIDFSHRLIWHGRKICIARRPQCSACGLADLCPSVQRAPRPAARHAARGSPSKSR